MSQFALILFDYDGCTAVVSSKKLTGGSVTKGNRLSFKLGRQQFKIEVLDVSDSKTILNSFEDEWSKTHRSLALFAEKERRGDVNGGYLDVWPTDPDTEVAVLTPNNPGIKKGTNGRQISVLHDGPRHYPEENTEPKRTPPFYDGLSRDQIDIIESAMAAAEDSRKSTSSQTSEVVIFGPDENPSQLLKGNQLKTSSTQTPNVKGIDVGTNTEPWVYSDEKLDSILSILSIINQQKLDEILKIMKSVQQSNQVQSLLYEATISSPVSFSEINDLMPSSSSDNVSSDTLPSVSFTTTQVLTSPSAVSSRIVPSTASTVQVPTIPAISSTVPTTELALVTATSAIHATSAVPTTASSVPLILSTLPTPAIDIPTVSMTVSTTSVSSSLTANSSTVTANALTLPVTLNTSDMHAATSVLSTDNSDMLTAAASLPVVSTLPTTVFDMSTVSLSTTVSSTTQVQPFPTISTSSIMTPAISIISADALTVTTTSLTVPATPNTISTSPVPSFTVHSTCPYMLRKCFPGGLYEISSAEDIHSVPLNVEVRVKPATQRDVQSTTCSRGNFSWKLAQQLFTHEELLSRNFAGVKGKEALSPRRVHAIEHSVMDTYGLNQENMKEMRNSINTGIRNLTRKARRLPFTNIQNHQ